jgi:signal peptidase II
MSPFTARSGWYGLAFLALAVLASDQLTKYTVEKLSVAGSLRVLIPGVLNLVHTNNPGVAFGLGADSQTPWMAPMLIAFSGGVIALLLWLLATGRAGGHLGQFGLALILGGAGGNVLDRVLRGSVTDFIDFHLGSHHWYTFNLADSAIVVGAGLVVLELFRDWKHHPSHEPRVN